MDKTNVSKRQLLSQTQVSKPKLQSLSRLTEHFLTKLQPLLHRTDKRDNVELLSQHDFIDPVKEPDFLAIKWLFFCPTGLISGLSSYWLKIPPVWIIFRLVCMWTGIILAILIGTVFVPAFDDYCCYRAQVSRRDLGLCSDSHSPINREPKSGPIRGPCGPYPYHIVILILCASILLIGAALSVVLEWMHVKRMYVHRMVHLAEQYAVGPLATKQEHDAAIHAIVQTTNATSYISRLVCFWAEFFPEFFVFGVFAKALYVRNLGIPMMSLNFIASILFIGASYEEDMYVAYGRCNAPHTALKDMLYCDRTIYPRSPVYIILNSVGAGVLMLSIMIFAGEIHESYHAMKTTTEFPFVILGLGPKTKEKLLDFINFVYPVAPSHDGNKIKPVGLVKT